MNCSSSHTVAILGRDLNFDQTLTFVGARPRSFSRLCRFYHVFWSRRDHWSCCWSHVGDGPFFAGRQSNCGCFCSWTGRLVPSCGYMSRYLESGWPRTGSYCVGSPISAHQHGTTRSTFTICYEPS